MSVVRNKQNKQINVCVNKDLYEKYQRLYPYTLSNYIRKCLLVACTNKQLFESILFGDVK